MRTVKTALISPAIDAMNAPATAEDQQRIFESKFGEMAYSAFSTKFPDLVDSIVTFKILDADSEIGTAVGAFIVEEEGEYVYVPAVLADNTLKPFDMMYVKSKDMFVPLTDDWLEETRRSTLATMGEGTKLPDTVATDVDIRNIIVPPTTGRYSYASAQINPRIRLEAQSTEPLGRKLANMIPPFPGGEGEAPSTFNPEVWATFVDQFNRIHGTTPGQAIDQGTMDIDALSKMYKSHNKTWSLDQPATKQAYDYKPVGEVVDSIAGTLARGAGYGAATGAFQAGKDFELADVPGSALRGAVGGAIAAPIGKTIGRALAHNYARPRTTDALMLGGDLGLATGGMAGGYLASRTPPDTIANMTRPSPAAWAEYYQQYPTRMPMGYPSEMVRTGSDYTDGLKAMVKHAARVQHEAPKQLLSYLTRAPNNVKEAFVRVLKKDKRVLKTAARLYGMDALSKALTFHKKAGVSHIGGALFVADKDTKPAEYAESFGSNAATAFNGVLLRGYYYKDTRPALNLAVQVQEYHDFQDANASGVYRLYNLTGNVEPALIMQEPIDLCEDDRTFFPRQEKTKFVRNRVARGDDNTEPHSLSRHDLVNPDADVKRSHKTNKLAIFGNGDYILCDCIAGEQVTEVFLKNTSLYRHVMTPNASAPTRGKGVFVYKTGSQYHCTKPVEIQTVSDSQGVIRGTLSALDGWTGDKKQFVIDKRSPINRVMRVKDHNLVVIPHNWKWMPLKENKSSSDYLHTAKALSSIVLDALGSMGANKVVVRSAGQGQFAVDGERTLDKAAGIRHIALKHKVPARAAESLLKIAAHTGKAEAFVVAPKQYRILHAFEKQAQGALMPGAEMAPSAVDQAFAESLSGIQSQIEQLQSQLSVLQQVQQRAMQIESEQQGVSPEMQDPSMQMQPPAPDMQAQGPDPAMQDPTMQDPTMQGTDPSMQMQDPEMPAQPEQPPLPIMYTESPSAEEIEQQINPDFLAQAGNLDETGVFDASAIASLAKSPSLKNTTSDYAAGMEQTLDDVGRTLLTLYMQAPQLKEELGEDGYAALENQLRDNFKGLGELLVNLTHQAPMLQQ